MKKKRRFKFWKVSAWLTGLNIFFAAMILILVYWVKLPNMTMNLPKVFNTGRFLLRMLASTIYQCLFYYFALNSFYKHIARRDRWPKYVLTALVYLAVCFVFSVLYDSTVRAE